ncbi:MAG: filamentous hemagglutinin N-terminal domain-containing protein, partial [Nitratireductor sp.]|nr:filamentous hemagglutinin N-terminal domain-containing protein [Nitratireductor sp.]
MFINRKLRDTLFASVSVGTLAAASSALGNPLDPTVIAGDVTISGTGSDHVIIQNDSMRSVVDWDSFSIGAGETTSINQIANDAAILNRVTGGDISEIYGTLESNGQVYLINENGILIGQGGLVDTGGFVASTLNVSNADFLGAGDMLFTQGIEAGGGITVHGTIRSVTGGDIFLLSREIEVGETGRIESNGGYVGLGAGEEILLRPVDSGDGRISIRAGKGKIINRGHVEAAAAELRAAGGNEYALAINNTGVVRANGVSKKGGRILLTGGGKVKNTGRVVARKKVVVRSTKKIVNAGTVKAGGDTGGEIIFEAPEISVEAGSLLDVSGALGGGRMFIGGGYQGSGADHAGNEVDIAENAQIVTVETGAVLNASATESGDAGEVIVWSDDTTTFAGDIIATAVDGAGGFAEISSKG